MNSLNIITARVSPSASPSPSRSNSVGSLGFAVSNDDDSRHDGQLQESPDSRPEADASADRVESDIYLDEKIHSSEDSPLLPESKEVITTGWLSLPGRIMENLLRSIRWVFATLTSPGVYLMACFYDEQGRFAPMTQLKKLFGVYPDHHHQKPPPRHSLAPQQQQGNKPARDALSSGYQTLSARPTTSSSKSSESESDDSQSTAGRHSRSQSLQPSDDSNNSRRSIRIKLTSEEAMRQRKHRKTQSAVARTKASEFGDDLSAHLKSPMSPTNALTKYPKAPAPPRPLIPRRQPSYLNMEPTRKPQKTLILDLDETLIHSMSKGGRMNNGHMVEVRLNAASLGLSGASNASSMAQHPVLYWVNKRPYCDEFLRRVCKWYNLVIFTASVQEYADPVIDWLEAERKFFSARYYRQHCTYRQGAYIKDLSSVEPDLSKVMILDNSPLSYLFHEGMLAIYSLHFKLNTNEPQTMPFLFRVGSMILRTTT